MKINTCQTCAHANKDDWDESLPHGPIIGCTHIRSYFYGRPVPAWCWCPNYVLEDQEPPADVLEQASREPGGESDGEREIRLLTERGGRVGGTW